MKNEILSSSLDELGYKLMDEIQRRNSFFSTITLVFPTKRINDWFKAFWLRNSSDLLINIRSMTLKEILPELIQNENNFQVMSRQQLFSFVLEELSNKNALSYLPKNIQDYLLEEKQRFINPQKLYDLSNTFTDLFSSYEKDDIMFDNYQKTLYENVLKRASQAYMTTLAEKFRTRNGMDPFGSLIFFGFTKIDKLEEKIIEEYAKENDFNYFGLIEDTSYKKEYHYLKAPSMEREVEALHSEICTLIKNNKNVSYSDFLVIIPSINDYETTIKKVFVSGDEKYPSIPFSINDRQKMDSEITTALHILFNTIAHGSYTRDDFISLVSNKMIAKARGIREDEAESFKECILKMEVYRTLKTRDDFDYARKRLLLSLVSSINDDGENIITLKGKDYIPYSSIDMDHEAIAKFVKVINDLESFKKTMEQSTVIDSESYHEIINEFDKWFSIKDSLGNETNGLYQKMLKSLRCFERESLNGSEISLATFIYFAKEESRIQKSNTRDFFSSGVTFTTFDSNTIVSARYVFFLNAGSGFLPSTKKVSELDLRDHDDISDHNQVKERTAFFLSYENAEQFYISFINRDLKTDEELYPSTFLLELLARKEPIEGKDGYQMSLDETRSYDKLFTKKEFHDKGYFKNLTSDRNMDVINDHVDINDYDSINKFKVSKISDFLTEPLIYKAQVLFGKEDDKDELLQNEYEPFDFEDNKDKGIIKKIAIDLLKNHRKEFNNEKGNEQIDYSEYGELKKKLNLQHKIPDINQPINEADFKRLINKAYAIQKQITIASNNCYEIVKLEDLPLNYFDENDSTKNTHWVLTSTEEVCRYKTSNMVMYYAYKDAGNDRDLIKLYAVALMDIASIKTNTSYEYEIELNAGKSNTKEDLKANFKLSPDKAVEILNQIYKMMNDYTENYYLPLFPAKNIKNFNDMKYCFDKEGFFKDKKLFDPSKDLGYNSETFYYDYVERKEKISNLILFKTDKSKQKKTKKTKESED